MRKYKLITLFVFVLTAVFLIAFFIPRPIIEKDTDIIWFRVQYNPYVGNSGEDLIEINDIDYKEISQCLSKYKEFPILSKSSGYSLENTELIITIHSDNEFKEVVVGNINYIFYGNGRLKHKIISSQALKNDLNSIVKRYISSE